MANITLKESNTAILRIWKENDGVYGVEYVVHYKDKHNNTYGGHYTNSLEDALDEFNKRSKEG